MHASRFFSYPKSYVVFLELTGRKEKLQDYQRMIRITQAGGNIKGLIVSIFDFSPFIEEREGTKYISYSAYNFYISPKDSVKTSSTFGFNKTFENFSNQIYDNAIVFEGFISRYLSLPQNAKFTINKQKHYHLTNLLNPSKQLEETDQLCFAALYLVDYYSRNLESPAYLEKDGSHDALVYICRNADKIKTVWNAAMHLGTLVTHAPVNSYQHQLPVPSDVFDEEKVKMINKLFVEKQNKK